MKIAINGFGRIGRSFFRAAFALPSEALAKDVPDFEIVAINDLTDTETLAYLLKYDSVYGRYGKSVESKKDSLKVSGQGVKIFTEKDPAKLPWKDLGIDIVIESTGFFTSSVKAQAHIDTGAKRVVITAPAYGDVTTALIGVNDDLFAKAGPLTCNASCTTNSVAPLLQILLEEYGVKKAGMVTVHGYTATQKLVDGPDSKDMRRGRAAAVNIVPSTTGAAEAVIQAIPDLAGKFDATAIRVPTITGSLSIITAYLKNKTSAAEINKMFYRVVQSSRWSKTVKVTEDPIVSTDIIGEPFGAIIDLGMTRVIDSDLTQIYSWYDNEAGYTATLVEHVMRVAANLI